MFTCSPQEKIIFELIKMTLFKVYIHMIVNTVLLPEWSTAVNVFFFCDSCSWVPCLYSKTACCSSEKYFRSFFGFQAFLCIWTLSNNDCMILRSFFTLRTTEGLICNYSTRFKRSRMLQKKKRCIKSFFLIFPKYHIFSSFSTAFRSYRRHLNVSQKTK